MSLFKPLLESAIMRLSTILHGHHLLKILWFLYISHYHYSRFEVYVYVYVIVYFLRFRGNTKTRKYMYIVIVQPYYQIEPYYLRHLPSLARPSSSFLSESGVHLFTRLFVLCFWLQVWGGLCEYFTFMEFSFSIAI